MVEQKGNSVTLMVEDSDPSFVNAVRRTIISEVPTLAIEYVTFFENNSPLYDEIIAHRLGLVPIKADLELFNFRDSCKCKGEGCPSCTLKLSLEKKGPGMVYSHDMKSEDPKMKPLKGIPLLKLGNGQKINLETEAILGVGKEHAKWQPAVASYKYYPDIEIGKECSGCGECVEVCPTHVLEMTKGKLKVVNLEACIFCNACVEACEAEALKVKGMEDKFIFKVEGTGVIKPLDVFDKAREIMVAKAKELEAIL